MTGNVILAGETDNSFVKVSTKADRKSKTNPTGVLVYTAFKNRQILQAPEFAYAAVKDDMVPSVKCKWENL